MFKKLENWVKGMKDRKEISFDGNIVEWNGEIPNEISQFIRDNCETLQWRVKMGGTQVDFTGLTFTSSLKSRRRRLLGNGRYGS